MTPLSSVDFEGNTLSEISSEKEISLTRIAYTFCESLSFRLEELKYHVRYTRSNFIKVQM